MALIAFCFLTSCAPVVLAVTHTIARDQLGEEHKIGSTVEKRGTSLSQTADEDCSNGGLTMASQDKPGIDLNQFAGSWILDDVDPIRGDDMLKYFNTPWLKRQVASSFSYGKGKLRTVVKVINERKFEKYSITPAIAMGMFSRPATVKLEVPVIGKVVNGIDHELGGHFHFETTVAQYEGVPCLKMTAHFRGDLDGEGKKETNLNDYAGKTTVNLWKPGVHRDGTRMFTAVTFMPTDPRRSPEEQLDISRASPVFKRYWKLQSEVNATVWTKEMEFPGGQIPTGGFKDNTPERLQEPE